ncbi:MAG TPA: hypothetical protein VL463_08495, partial [Kofleriaceae bacterium]|nr:hypothetical protein [Kofleriaceae bacterium]
MKALRLALFLAACSAGHTHANAPEAGAAPVAVVATDAAPAVVDSAPAKAPGTLDESMAQPFFPDAGARFALEDWAGARELYAKARDGAKDDLTRARATLMIGLCDARLAAWD